MEEKKLCKYGCGLEAKFQLKSSEWICSKSHNSCPIIKEKHLNGIEKFKLINPNNKIGFKKNHISWSKGLTKNTDERLLKMSKNVSNSIINLMNNGHELGFTKWAKSDEGRKLLSIKRSEYLQNHSNQCKWFEFNNGKKIIKVQGTWEKIFVEYLIKNNIKWDRIRIFYDKTRTYTPDFYLPDYNMYIEVKGWMRERDIIKMKKVYNECYIDLRLIEKTEINNIQNNFPIEILKLTKFIEKY